MFPNAKIIFIHRDPPAALASSLKVRKVKKREIKGERVRERDGEIEQREQEKREIKKEQGRAKRK